MANFNKDVLNNTGSIVNGDITEDNDVLVASGRGSTVIGEDADNNVVASGAGSVASGGDATLAGPGSAVLQGSTVGNFANNSDGAILGRDISGANTGLVKDGIVAGGDVEDTVVGDGNLQFNPDGGSFDGAALSFGSGDATAVGTNFGALATGNSSAQQIAGNTLGDGAALGGRDATTVSDDDETNVLNIKDSSNVNVAQDESAAFAEQDDIDLAISRSFNEDNDTFKQDNDVFQNREDNDITKIVDFD